MEDPKQSVGRAFGAAAATYDTVVPFFATFGRALVDEAGLRPGQRVLDVACGRGATLWPALDAVGPGGAVTAIDIAPEMVALLSDATAAVPNADVRVGDAEAVDEPDAAFDAVLCAFGIFFLPRPDVALAEWRRVLRPGGTVALSTFVGAGGFPWVADVVREVLPGGQPGPAASGAEPLTRSEAVRGALADAGFTGARTATISHRFVFPDVDAVVAWYASHGGRMFLDRFDDGQHAAFRRLVAERLDAGHRAPEGGYELVQGAEATVATARHPFCA